MHHFSRARRPLPFAVSTLAAALLAASAHAQEAALPPAATATELETINVTAAQDTGTDSYTVGETAAPTRLKLALRDTPQSVSVITRERMDDQNLQTLRDVLDNTTGIYSFGYDTERTLFTTRGFVINNTQIDGVPTLTRSNSDSTDASLDTAIYERIEVVRGATGLLTGAGNPSAAINLVRKRADSRDLKGSVDLSAGSWNDYRGMVDVASGLTESGNVRGRFVGVYESAESYMDFYSSARNVFYGVIDVDLTPSTVVSVGYDYQKTSPDAVTWGWFPLYFSDGGEANWGRSFSTAANWTFWDNTTETAFVDLRQDLGNDWQLRASFSHREADGDMALFYMNFMDASYTAPVNFPDRGTGAGPLPATYRSKEYNQQNALDVYASGPLQLLGREQELVIGATGSKLKKRADEYLALSALPPIGSLYGWDGSYPMPDFDSQPTDLGHTRTDQTGIYSALRLSPADPLKIILGARYSLWKTDQLEYGVNHLYDFKEVTPYAGVIFDITPAVSAFASYTEIFTPQAYQDSSGAYLDPISGISREAGLKSEHLDGRLNTSLTLFDTRQDNVAVPDPGKTLPDGVSQAYYGADGSTSRGFELDVSGAITEDWKASLGWSYSKLEDADGNPLNSYIPRTLVRLFTTWKLPGDLKRIKVGGGFNWQSKSSLDTTCPSGVCRLEQDPVFLLNLMASYQVTPQFSAQLNAENLLDKTYYVVGEYDSVYYGPPANVTLGLKYQF